MKYLIVVDIGKFHDQRWVHDLLAVDDEAARDRAMELVRCFRGYDRWALFHSEVCIENYVGGMYWTLEYHPRST